MKRGSSRIGDFFLPASLHRGGESPALRKNKSKSRRASLPANRHPFPAASWAAASEGARNRLEKNRPAPCRTPAEQQVAALLLQVFIESSYVKHVASEEVVAQRATANLFTS